ncbi:hypothetical protein ACFFX0_24855 [Citricoccus parietis]
MSTSPSRASTSCRSGIIRAWNWCRITSFSGRSCSATSSASQAVVSLTSAAETCPICSMCRWPGCSRHSGSSASPTCGCSSSSSKACAWVVKSWVPGCRSRTT